MNAQATTDGHIALTMTSAEATLLARILRKQTHILALAAGQLEDARRDASYVRAEQHTLDTAAVSLLKAIEGCTR
jgi:hypothetical protein